MIWAAVKKAAPEQDHIESHGVGLMFRKALRSVKKREKVDIGGQAIRVETNLKPSSKFHSYIFKYSLMNNIYSQWGF